MKLPLRKEVYTISTSLSPEECVQRLKAQMEPLEERNFWVNKRWLKEIKGQLPHWFGSLDCDGFELRSNFTPLGLQYLPQIVGKITQADQNRTVVSFQFRLTASEIFINVWCLLLVGLPLVATMLSRRFSELVINIGISTVFAAIGFFSTNAQYAKIRNKMIEQLNKDLSGTAESPK